MKIVQICPYAMSRPGGVQRHVADLADWLTGEGHQTRIVAPPAPRADPDSDRRLSELGRTRAVSLHGTSFELSIASPRRVRALARDLHGWGADVVHLHTPWTPALAWQVWRALRLPTVTTLHATLPTDNGRGPVDRYIRTMARYFIARSHSIIVPSEAPLALIQRLVPQKRVDILPPAVDLSDWRAACTVRPVEGPVHLVFMGRLEERKGVAVLLDAWRRLAERRTGLRLTIAGDGALRPKVEAAVAADGSQRLQYVGRPDGATARRLIGAADLFIAPAPFGESFGIVLAEAMSAGAVPVAADNPGYASVLGARGGDLLVPSGDPAALADRIAALAANPALRRSLRDWGGEHAGAFDIRRVGPSYLRLFQAAGSR